MIGLQRREFLWLSLMTPVATLVACRKPTVYEGELDQLDGRQLLTVAELTEVASQLKGSEDPFTEKIVADILGLYPAGRAPSDFPDWVSPEAFPVPVTRDNGDESSAVYSFRTSVEPEDFFYLKLPGEQQAALIDFDGAEVLFGINLGVPSELVQRNGKIAESILLAKEHVSHMLLFRMAEQFGNFILGNLGGKFFDSAHREITDSELIRRYGAVAFMVQINNRDSDLWEVVDKGPLLLLGPSLYALMAAGKFPQESFGLTPFILAANGVVDNPGLYEEVTRIRKDWLNGGSMLPADGTFERMAGSTMVEAVRYLGENY